MSRLAKRTVGKSFLLGNTLALVLGAMVGSAWAGDGKHYKLGRIALPEEVAAWNTDVRPDGQGLPDGVGSVAQGEVIYVERCAACHGEFGEGVGRWPVLAGGGETLDTEDPVKTIGSYWPYASTVIDYVHRAMPFGEARSLANDELYSVVAYVFYLNDLLDEEEVLSKENFLDIKMPNEANFFPDDRVRVEFKPKTVCMQACKETVEITGRARIIDVTPKIEGEVLD